MMKTNKHGNFTVQLGLKYDYSQDELPVTTYKLTREEMDQYLKKRKSHQVERRKRKCQNSI